MEKNNMMKELKERIKQNRSEAEVETKPDKEELKSTPHVSRVDNASQVTCPSCQGIKQQLLLISRLEDRTKIDLICMTCGILHSLFFSGILSQDNFIAEQKQEKKETLSYLG